MTPPRRSQAHYSQQLKDPRWQKMRLRIFERDGFKCTCCGEDKERLEVHHLVYRNGADPWEYNPEELITLCHKCHKFEHQLLTLKSVGIDPVAVEKKLKARMGI